MANGLSVELLGEPKQYQSVLDGLEVTVVDQDYLISTINAGRFELTAPSFTGTFIHGDRRTGSTQIVDANTQGKRYQIEVKPIPENYSGQWLPADKLQMHQTWETSEGVTLGGDKRHQVKLGDSLTRTIVLTISGLTQTQFPDLSLDVPSSVRSYPEKPQYATNPDGSISMTIKQVVLPGTEGDLTIQGLNLLGGTQ
ncbi:BatD family protein [Vibrio sonorensis]|uniref:BatD family protein n=1 Tax=Vibrio sonorensis TaxID=1004316 RepID=UPI001586B1F4|nr:BatD family protein [Vibrio sonorensis]